MLTDRQQEILQVWNESGQSTKSSAKKLGISKENLRKNLFYIALKGVKISPATYNEHLPPGWGMTKTTLQRRRDPESGEMIVVGDWPRGAPIQENTEGLLEYLKTRMPISPISKVPAAHFDENIQLEWTIADLHFGMLSWRKETGEDYDIKIARNLLLDCASEVFSRVGHVKETVLVLMGDNFHTDFFEAKTERSGNVLDTDSRYPKMVNVGFDTYVSAIEICLQFSEKVKVIVLYGNHDQQLSSVLPTMFYAWFRNEPRVEIDRSPAKQHYNIWGCNATTYHHGDGTKKQRLCGDFTRYLAEKGVPGLKFFYAKQAHLHAEYVEDINGVIYEVVPSPVAHDQYAKASVFSHKRATVANLYHKSYGKLARIEITPHMLEAKKNNKL